MTVRRAGPPQASTAPSGGSEVHEVTSVGAMTVRRAGPPQASTAPSGGSEAHEVTSVGAMTVRRAGPPQASTAPSGGTLRYLRAIRIMLDREDHIPFKPGPAVEAQSPHPSPLPEGEGVKRGVPIQAGAAGLALPDRRRSGPLGGQGVTRSERPWGRYSSRGRGTGFARPQAQRPPRGAGSYAKRTTVGAIYLRPPRGAANHTKWGAWGSNVWSA